MKKLMLLALAALSVSVAQAITVNWTLTVSGPSAGGTAGYQPGWVGIALVQGSISDLSGYTTSADTNGSFTMTATSTSAPAATVISSFTADDTSYTSAYNNLGESEGTVSVTFTSTIADGVDTVTFVVYNQYNYGTSSGAGGYGLLTVTDVDQLEDNATVVLDWATLAWAQSSAVTAEASAVPEPTCLALLALGVAGIALRRRA